MWDSLSILRRKRCYSGLLSVTVAKCWWKPTWEERVYFISQVLGHSSSLKEDMPGTQRKRLDSGPEVKTMMQCQQRSKSSCPCGTGYASEFPWLPNITSNCNSLNYLTERDGRAILLKAPDTWVIEYRENKLILTSKLLWHWLALMVLEGALHATGGQKFSVLPSCEPWKLW